MFWLVDVDVVGFLVFLSLVLVSIGVMGVLLSIFEVMDVGVWVFWVMGVGDLYA